MNIWAVGRNYTEHAKELGNNVPSRETEPMIFLKAGSTVVSNGAVFSLPLFSSDIHYECEVAFRFDRHLQLSEMTLALDLTARAVQSKLKAAGHPWTLAKSFKASCPLGPWIPSPPDTQDIRFSFKVNGEIRQTGNTRDMIFSVEELRKYVTDCFPVESGDLLLSGTPAGVGLLRKGDRLEAEIENKLKASWSVEA